MERIERTIDLGGISATVRELTVAEYRSLIKLPPETDLMRAMLVEGFTFSELERMTDLTAEQLDSFTPSMLAKVAEACKEVHQSFFLMLARAEAIEKVIEERSKET